MANATRSGPSDGQSGTPGRRTRVLYDALDVKVDGKGVSRSLVEIYRELRNHEQPIELIVATTRDGAKVLGVDASAPDVVIVPRVRGVRWEQWELPRLARRLACDVVYTQRECPPIWGPAIAVHIHEVPDVRDHEPAEYTHERLRRAYARLVFTRGIRHARAVMVSSQETRTDLLRRTAVDAEVVPLGVDAQRFCDKGVPRTHLLHIGSVDPRDLTDVVVTAYEQCSQSQSMPPIIICGNVEDKRQVANVKYVGRVSDDDLVSLLNSAILCIQPSMHEGFGLQNLEAMSCGAPLIAIDIPSVREVVGDAARLLPDASTSDLATAMLGLVADESARAALSAGGRRRAAEYPWSNTARAIERTVLRVARATDNSETPSP